MTGETADPSPDFRSFTIRLAGREAQRGTVLPELFRALGKLPGYWQTLTGGNLSAPVTVAALTLKETGRIEPGTAAGRRVWTLAAELTARICTAPPRSGLSSQSLT